MLCDLCAWLGYAKKASITWRSQSSQCGITGYPYTSIKFCLIRGAVKEPRNYNFMTRFYVIALA